MVVWPGRRAARDALYTAGDGCATCCRTVIEILNACRIDDGTGGGASTVDGLLAAVNEGTAGCAAVRNGLCPSGIDRDVVGGAVDNLGTPRVNGAAVGNAAHENGLHAAIYGGVIGCAENPVQSTRYNRPAIDAA